MLLHSYQSIINSPNKSDKSDKSSKPGKLS